MKLLFLKIILLILYITNTLAGIRYLTRFKKICGKKSHVTKRIINGLNSTVGEFPWFARINLRDETSNKITFFCGGSLITDRHILTADHCFYGSSRSQTIHNLIVTLGNHNVKTDENCNDKQCSGQVMSYSVDKLFPSHLDENKLDDDIALMKLETKVKFTKFISPICLPDSDFPKSLLGKTATVIGYGIVDIITRQTPNILQKIDIIIKELHECEQLGPEPGEICAGNERKDACAGDSGGPLFINLNRTIGPRYTQVGIVSYGSPICGNTYPAIYADVNYYMKWIDGFLSM